MNMSNVETNVVLDMVKQEGGRVAGVEQGTDQALRLVVERGDRSAALRLHWVANDPRRWMKARRVIRQALCSLEA